MSIDYYSDKRLTDNSGAGASLYFEGSGRLVRLDKRSMTIGRDETCDITLNASTVSRSHARIFTDGNNWYLQDLGSVNGMSVNGSTLASHETVKLYNNYNIIFADNLYAVFHDGRSGMNYGAETAFLHKKRSTTPKTEPISPNVNEAVPQQEQPYMNSQRDSGAWRNPYYDAPKPKRCEPPIQPQQQYAAYASEYAKNKRKTLLLILVPLVSVLLCGGILLAALTRGGKNTPAPDLEPQAGLVMGDKARESVDAERGKSEGEETASSPEKRHKEYTYKDDIIEVEESSEECRIVELGKPWVAPELRIYIKTSPEESEEEREYIVYIRVIEQDDFSNEKWVSLGTYTIKDGQIDEKIPLEGRPVLAVAITPVDYLEWEINGRRVVPPEQSVDNGK